MRKERQRGGGVGECFFGTVGLVAEQAEAAEIPPFAARKANRACQGETGLEVLLGRGVIAEFACDDTKVGLRNREAAAVAEFTSQLGHLCILVLRGLMVAPIEVDVAERIACAAFAVTVTGLVRNRQPLL